MRSSSTPGLGRHHASADEVWIKIHKVASGLPSITPKEAIDVVLCWGWIDAVRKGLDETSYLQRYTPRTAKSIWSKINIDNVARLTDERRMTEHGLRQVEAAKADGRWDNAYGSGKGMKIPDDLQAAIDAEPEARAMLAKLTEQNRFALAFRTHHMKTEGRPEAEDRDLRRDAEAGRDDLPAARAVTSPETRATVIDAQYSGPMAAATKAKEYHAKRWSRPRVGRPRVGRPRVG